MWLITYDERKCLHEVIKTGRFRLSSRTVFHQSAVSFCVLHRFAFAKSVAPVGPCGGQSVDTEGLLRPTRVSRRFLPVSRVAKQKERDELCFET